MYMGLSETHLSARENFPRLMGQELLQLVFSELLSLGAVGVHQVELATYSPSHLRPCRASPHSSVPQCSQKVGLR